MNQSASSNKIYSGKVAWKSPSNIALVKYWGKYGNQLPRNPSLSITLHESVTTTKVEYDIRPGHKGPTIDFYFENKLAPAFGDRIQTFLKNQVNDYQYLKESHLTIHSANTFPHSSGIASSASSFSSLALCLTDIQRIISGEKDKNLEFLMHASELARLGSGSASRSVYGGYVVWGALKGFNAYSDNFAVPVFSEIHPVFLDFQDAILIVSADEKKVGSSAGHALMNEHPFSEARYKQAVKHMTKLHEVLRSGDLEAFVEIVENEALSLHALMMASNPGYLLMKHNTIQIIEKIRAFRNEENIPVCFTLDAGPNVHLLYPNEYKAKVGKWIEEELASYCSNDHWIDDGLGQGPEKMI